MDGGQCSVSRCWRLTSFSSGFSSFSFTPLVSLLSWTRMKTIVGKNVLFFQLVALFLLSVYMCKYLSHSSRFRALSNLTKLLDVSLSGGQTFFLMAFCDNQRQISKYYFLSVHFFGFFPTMTMTKTTMLAMRTTRTHCPKRAMRTMSWSCRPKMKSRTRKRRKKGNLFKFLHILPTC